ncbi:MAG TPA: N-acetylmuramoyl-L-alanine amidase [Thermodesulfovibrionia bacterium]|nr:N-acetylmuramoyl-L-alanine amidase [Thermodesulfovibrionia bacterium]
MIKAIRLSIFFVILFFSLLLYASDSLSQCNKKTFTIAIDIGHTKDQPGATSYRGISEFYFNQNIGQRLFEELVLHGFKQTFIINKNGNSISLTDRTDISNKRKTDLFLSIHHDSVQPLYLSSWIHKGKQFLYSDEFSGYSIFYSQKNYKPKSSLEFARLLGSELRSNLFVPTLHHAENIKGENRKLVDKEKGIYEFNDLVVLKTATMPSVLIECGIIVNRDEEILLSNPVYQKAIVLSIVNAVEKFCN